MHVGIIVGEFMKKLGMFVAALACLLIASGSAKAQLFQQNFESSTNVSDYVNAAAPNNGQFNAISTSGAGTTVSINTVSGNNVLQYTRAGANAGSFSRTTDFSPTPTTLKYQVDVAVTGNTAAQTTAATFQVGSGFGTANSTEANASTYARFAINLSATNGNFSVRDISSATNSAEFSGTQRITWILNNSGSTLSYTAPDCSTQTVNNDTADVYVGNTLVFDNVAVLTATQTITDLKFVYSAGSGTIRLDNFLINPIITAGTTYNWVGPTLGLGDYNLAANWSPARSLPATNDVLVINTGFTPTLTNVPTQTIAALRVTNNTSATLTTLAANTLTINGGTCTDLQVDAGSALTLADVTPLKLSIASGSTGTVAGLMLFQDSGHRLIGNTASAVTFQNGALFTTAANFTGNAFGTGSAGDGAAGSIIFASGSKYIHNGGSSPFGASGNAAVAIFQTGSEANWLTTAGFQASGRTYADLTVGNASTTVALSDSGSGNFQFDNLTLKNNSTLTFNGSGASTVTIQGDITSEGAGASSDVMLTGGTGGIVLNKAGTQTLSGGGGKTVTFGSAATVNSGTTLALARILIQTDPTVLIVNGSLTRTTGYVIGNLQKPYSAIGAKTFEVGTANGYSPVTADVTALGITPSSLRVKAVQGNQPTLAAATSLKRYWTLTEVGDLTANLTFNYLDPTDIMGNESNYQLVRIEGGTATRLTSAVIDTANNTATINGVQNFSDWTLAEPLAPTAASVTVSGRVMNANGAGLGRATVMLLDTNTNQTRTAQTRGDGSYVFEDVPVGTLYVITVRARRYTFAPATQSFMLTDALGNVNFVGGRE